MRAIVAVWIALLRCSPGAPEPEQPREKGRVMSDTLSPALDAELAEIRKDPGESVGFGFKADIPYVPNRADSLIASREPGVTERLIAEVHGPGDRVYRLAVLHVLGKRADAAVDAALVGLLDDPELCATAAYLLGAAGYREYPARARDTEAVLAALRRHVDDASRFVDPFHRKSFRTQDFVIAAYVRIAGPDRFTLANPDLVGHGLPAFTDAERAALLAQIGK
ncbi:MAG TPA: hypothetical protein VF516_28630 [Kofleriaceae bacterium]